MQSHFSLEFIQKFPLSKGIKNMGSDTLSTLNKLLAALREGLDMSKFGFPLLTEFQKDKLIRTILSLIVFLRLIQRGADNITLISSFTSLISNIISPTKVLDHVILLFNTLNEELHDIWDSFKQGYAAGFDSQSSDFSLPNTLSFFFLQGKKSIKHLDSVLQDRLILVIQTFITKIVSIWFTLSNGFVPEDINMDTLSELVSNSYSTIKDSNDIIDMIYSSVTCIAENWNDLIQGNINSLLLGKTESAKFEATCARIEGMYKIVRAKQSDLLKKEYDHTYESFNHLVVDTLRIGKNHMKAQTGTVLTVLKGMITRLEIIRSELLLAIQNESLKPQPVGILLFGGSSVGKSTVQETLAKTILSAHGIVALPGMINAVNYSDKFDSTTTSDSKVTLADDAGNAQSREDYSERIIDHINSQRRPINKAGVEDKGVHFYNNLGHIASTNDHRMRNIVKSICLESVFRRFPMHIHVKAKPQYRKIKSDENSGFSDEKTCMLTTEERLDAYEFDIYEFKHMVDDGNEPKVDIICEDQDHAKFVILDGMAFEKVLLPDCDIPSLELLKNYVFKRTKELHKSALKTLASMESLNSAKTCMLCGMTCTYCNCANKSDSQVAIVDTSLRWFGNVKDMTTTRLVSAHAEVMHGLQSRDPRFMMQLTFNKMRTLNYVYHNRRTCVNNILVFSLWKYILQMVWLLLALYYSIEMQSQYLTVFNTCFILLIPFIWIRKVLRTELVRIETELNYRPNILTQLVPESSMLRRERAKQLFVWFPAVLGAYMVYKLFRTDYSNQDDVYEAETSNLPHTKWEYTKEKQHQAPSMSLKAHSTTGESLANKIASNMAVVIVSSKSGQKQALSLPIKGNYYLVPTHCLPVDEEYDLVFYPNGVNNNAGKAKVPKVSSCDLSEIEGSDYTIVKVVSSAPRWDLTSYLPLEAFSKRFGTYITQLTTGEVSQEKSVISRHTRLGIGTKVVTTSGVVITNAYRAELKNPTRQGMCGSAFIDETRGVILGFHSAGSKNIAIFSSLTLMDVETAMVKFNKGYQPTSQATLDVGSENGYSLIKGDKWMSKRVENDDYNMEVNKHTWINHGVVLKDGSPVEEVPQSPFCKSDYLPAVVAAFGATLVGPPQEMSADYHKKKAAIDYNTPKQDFSSLEVNRAKEDYLKPILSKIRHMKATQPELFDEVKRELSVQEALDGIGEQGLTGINNSSSVGWPFSGAKKKFMIKDSIDPNVPMMPRTFDQSLYPLAERQGRIRANAELGIRSNFIVKTCSKTNELLPISKKKCRPFQAMGTDVLVTCRQIFSPMVRFFGSNKYLTECMLGINMKSHEAGEFRDFMTTFNEDMCIAGDFKAYDRNMSAQITSAASDIIYRILEEFEYTDSQLKLVNGLLTEIIYPHMNFYGQVFELANSNPSGQPLTTHLNSIANSLYTRIIFFELCPHIDDFRSNVKLATYGDDNAMNVANHLRGQFTHTKMSAVYADKYDMVYTMDKKDAESVPYQDFADLGFLKQRIVYNADYDAYVPLLDQSSIIKSLHWQKKAKDCEDPPHVQFASKVDAGLREASHYGRDYFDQYASKIQSVKDANSTALQVMKIPTYDALVRKYKWAFHPEYSCNAVELFDSQAAVWPEVNSNHMFAWKAGQFVAYCTSTELLWAAMPWSKLVSRLPRNFNYLLGFQHESVLIMNVNEILTYQAAIEAGRFEATPFINRKEYTLRLTEFKTQLELNRFIVFPSALNSIYQAHKRLCTSLQRITLTSHPLPVRKAPITVCLCGGTGLGKTGIALNLVKQMLAAIDEEISSLDSRICVLNETDSFQSEYTSDTLAVIFDDIANDKPDTLSENPLRKVLDFSNNICKMALAPEAEKKGIIAIRPKIVMCTTNASPKMAVYSMDRNSGNDLLCAGHWSVAPMAYYRRFDMIINIKPRCSRVTTDFEGNNGIDWDNDGPSFWRFELIKYVKTDGYSGTPMVDSVVDIYQLMEMARDIAIAKDRSQGKFMDQVVETLDKPMCKHNLIHKYCRHCAFSDEDPYEVFESQAASFTVKLVHKLTDIIPMLRFYDVVTYDNVDYTLRYSSYESGRNVLIKKISILEERMKASDITTIWMHDDQLSSISTMLLFYDVVYVDSDAFVATIQAQIYCEAVSNKCVHLRKLNHNDHLK